MTKLTHARTLSMWNGAFFISFTVFTHGWWWLVVFVHLLESSKWRRKWLTTNGSHFKDGVHKCLDHNNYLTYTHTHRNYKKKTPNPIELERIKVYFTCVVKTTMIQMDETESTIIVIIIILTDRSKKIFLLYYTISLCVCVCVWIIGLHTNI